MEYRLVLLTLVLLWHPAHGSRIETELCYIKGLPNNTTVCRTTTKVSCCNREDTSGIIVTVYRGANCNSPSQCGSGKEGCCSKSTKINITKEYSNALKLSFISTKCFNEVNSNNIVSSSMPNNTGLDLVVVSFNCPDTAIMQITGDAIQIMEHTTKESSSKVAAAVAVPVTIVVVGAVVVGTIFYMRRRRSRNDATEQRQEIHTNNAYIGSVSRYVGLHQNAHPSIKAEDQGTNHYYAGIADNKVHFNHSSTEDNEYQPIKPNERTANNGPPTNSYTTDKNPTEEDEYDHLGTQDTPSSGANNYEHITHISKDNCHSILYDKTEFNHLNTNSFDDEDNYNHAQQNGAAGRTETDDRDGGYTHVGGIVDGSRADDQYSTMESVVETQDGSRHLNNYFVLDKHY